MELLVGTPQHVVITAGNQGFSGTMLPRNETFTRIQNVSTKLNLNTRVWRTDRDDKTPTLKPVGIETGDDTVVAITDGQSLSMNYVSLPVPTSPILAGPGSNVHDALR
jgi:hypothetical protein